MPEELGCCENLEKLELAMNRDLDELPNEVLITLNAYIYIYIAYFVYIYPLKYLL